MSTTTNDQESVTVPLNLGLLQSLLSLQFVQLSQQGNQGSNNTANPASALAKGPAQGNQFKPQGGQQKPQNQGPKNLVQQGANPNANKQIGDIQDAKKDQNKLTSSSGANAQNPLALLLMQLNQSGLGGLLQQAAGGQANQNNKTSNLNLNESSNGSISRGIGTGTGTGVGNGPSKFKYSSTLSGDRPPGSREDSNSRTRPFPNRQDNFNNDGNNNFRNRNNGNNNGNFQQRFNNNNRGNFQPRGRNFNNENNGDNGRFQGRNQNDFSRSRSRDKSTDVRNGVFGGLQKNSNGFHGNQGGRNPNFNNGPRVPFPQNQRKGDWQCPNEECKNINFATRSQCNRCGIDKPQELIDMEEERRNNAPTFKKGDWNCPSCRNLNFAKRTSCNRCGGERPEETYESYKPRGFNDNHNGEFDGNNDNYEPGEVGNNNQNDWVNNAGNAGNEGLEDGEVAEW